MRSLDLFRKVVVGAALLIAPVASYAGIFISVGIAPPMLPIYTQPICPGDGYLWTPGYWAYGDEGYFWVPGVWVQPPVVGYLWTPGYWGWDNGFYRFNEGYWGPHVGFYGGVNYGFGYMGSGYEGGYWDHDRFNYNRSVNNINITNVHNVYNKTVVVNNVTYNRVSYNGGNGGVPARPSAQEQVALRERHVPVTQNQAQHQQMAAQNRQQLASVNHGNPAIAAQARVGDRTNIVPARSFANAGQAGPASGQRQQVQQNGAGQQPNRNTAAQGQFQARPQGQQQVRPEPQQQVRPEPQVRPQPQMQQVRPQGQRRFAHSHSSRFDRSLRFALSHRCSRFVRRDSSRCDRSLRFVLSRRCSRSVHSHSRRLDHRLSLNGGRRHLDRRVRLGTSTRDRVRVDRDGWPANFAGHFFFCRRREVFVPAWVSVLVADQYGR